MNIRNKSGFIPLLPLILVGVVATGLIAFYIRANTSQDIELEEVILTEEWQVYKNEDVGYLFSYPVNFSTSDMIFTSYSEKDMPSSNVEVDLSDYIKDYLKVDAPVDGFYYSTEDFLNMIKTKYKGSSMQCKILSERKKQTSKMLTYLEIVEKCDYPGLVDWSSDYKIHAIFSKEEIPYIMTGQIPQLDSQYKEVFDQILSTFEFTEPPQKDNSASKSLCSSEENTVWLEEFNECESLSPSVCKENGGQFKGCESACRHDPSPGFCIEVCVPVCKF